MDGSFTFQKNIFKQTLNCAPRKVLEEKKKQTARPFANIDEKTSEWMIHVSM